MAGPPVKIDLETWVKQSGALTVSLVRLWNNLTPSALSEVIRGKIDSLLMGRIFSSATVDVSVQPPLCIFYLSH